MEWTIRREEPADYRETEALTRAAFWNQYAPGCVEHALLHRLRGCPAFVPELDLVAVRDGQIVGNCVCVTGCIRGDDGTERQVLTLGPISVLPPLQGRGIGGDLLRRTRALARDMGFRAILLCGDPDYYTRHGFSPAETWDVRTSDGMYAAALLGCPLYEGALDGAAGRYFEDPAYEVDPAEAEAFDRDFPPMEKVSGTAGQRRFLELAAMRRPAPERRRHS
ncbi:GNAT family N-acetyltransferase [Dysosmobacter sp.]|uniref:GNAT family N-acetyltransferase n=1 Tax=Dysosmobacter sp. TaxID=2591382 RepID=UPI002AA048E3|nr:N-acetyltransferase [Dysosmobacter sp.]MCI6054943.1 N-acetyltransferase [Dysosmobacter sp.]MDY5510871.1 N-acetyltransferase [Dysosmobacter sp.]